MKLEFTFQYRHDNRSSDAFTLAVEACWTGDLHFIRGPSGSGKSTLLRLLAGLIKPNQGAFLLNGQMLQDTKRQVHTPAELRKVGMVFQENLLFPHLSVERNVLYGTSDLEFATLLMRELDISSIRRAKPAEISGGQQRRVAIARALAAKPELLLLDEPFTGLNEELRVSLSHLLQRIRNDYKVGLIVVSHDYVDLFEDVDSSSIHFMDCGQLVGS